jgi:hypothetical protein
MTCTACLRNCRRTSCAGKSTQNSKFWMYSWPSVSYYLTLIGQVSHRSAYSFLFWSSEIGSDCLIDLFLNLYI